MKKVNLVYWAENDNFGDLLSPFIVNRMFQNEVLIIHKDLCKSSYIQWAKVIIKKILNYHVEDLHTYLKPYEKSLFAVGSILQWANKRAIVWGSGFMNSDDKYNGGQIYALRGKLSAAKVVESGGGKCDVFGDPALLLPLFVSPSKLKMYKLGIIPHFTEFLFFKKKYGDLYHVINLGSKNIEKIVEEITSCEVVLSTSLHGIIVAHAYGIPALWIKNGNINTDGFKFHDYFSSVNIEKYMGFENYEEILWNKKKAKFLFGSTIALPNIEICQIQDKLLKAFPLNLF